MSPASPPRPATKQAPARSHVGPDRWVARGQPGASRSRRVRPAGSRTQAGTASTADHVVVGEQLRARGTMNLGRSIAGIPSLPGPPGTTLAANAFSPVGPPPADRVATWDPE